MSTKFKYYIEYSLSDGILQHKPVYPVDGGSTFSSEVVDWKERQKFDSKYKFKNQPAETIFDYDLLKTIEVDNPFNRIIFIVQKYISGSWDEVIRGHFVIADCEVNDDLCFYEVQPEVDDEYTCIDDIKDKEYNWLEVPVAPMYIVCNPTNLELFKCTKNYTVYTTEYHPGCGCPIYDDLSGSPIHDNVQAGSTLTDNVVGLPYAFDALAGGTLSFGQDTNTAYHPLVILTNEDMLTPNFPAFVFNPANVNYIMNLYRIYTNRFIKTSYAGTPNYYNFLVETTWCIESAITLNDPITGANVPPVGLGWVPAYQLYQGGLLACKWMREPFYGNQYYSYYLSDDNCNDFTWTLLNPYSAQPAGHISMYRGRSLNEVVQYFLNKANCNLTLKSEFYQNDINPVTGDNNVFYLLNDGSDCKSPNATQPATFNLTSFDRILRNLMIIHNVRWCIKDGAFVIEHISYFENGYSYTNNNWSVTDLRTLISNQTEKPEIIKTNKYNYDRSNIYQTEKIENTNYLDFDFSPVIIDYALFISKSRNINQLNIDFVLDFAGIYGTPSNFSNDDIVMVAYRIVNVDPVNGNHLPVVINEPGYRTNEDVTNGYLCLSNLFNRFWRNQRQLLKGVMNGNNEVFNTQTGKILQTVTIKDCDLKYFKEFTLFKTNLGEGRKLSSKHNAQLETTEIKGLI